MYRHFYNVVGLSYSSEGTLDSIVYLQTLSYIAGCMRWPHYFVISFSRSSSTFFLETHKFIKLWLVTTMSWTKIASNKMLQNWNWKWIMTIMKRLSLVIPLIRLFWLRTRTNNRNFSNVRLTTFCQFSHLTVKTEIFSACKCVLLSIQCGNTKEWKC